MTFEEEGVISLIIPAAKVFIFGLAVEIQAGIMDMKRFNLKNEDVEQNEPKNTNNEKCQWWSKLSPDLKAIFILFSFGAVLLIISFATCGIGRHFKMCPLPR